MNNNFDDEEINFNYDLNDFQKFIDSYKQSEIWKTMEVTVENSPWHREKNVAVHTEMTVFEATKILDRQYPSGSPENNRVRVLVTLALLFHDAGKPPAQVVKETEERGVYRSYAGHEQMSARTFESYAVDNWTVLSKIISAWDVFVVTWMIEHHLPYSISRPRKVRAFASAMKTLFKDSTTDIFFIMLQGDQRGRISDNWEVNTANMMDWIEDMKGHINNLPEEVESPQKTKRLIMLIAAPGSGKSTIRSSMANNYSTYCLDDLRLDYLFSHPSYDASKPYTPTESYKMAFDLSCEDKGFDVFAKDRLDTLFKYQDAIIIDNTNVSTKKRVQYLETARLYNFSTTALYIPASLNLLLDRNKTRTDKTLPDEAIARLYNAIQLPSFGDFAEFDDVFVIPANLPGAL